MGTWRFTLLTIGMVVVGIVFGLAPIYFINGWQDRGSFGDMFGAVNALFSGVALLGVIYAIFLQKEELELQRIELRRSAEAQEKSEVALRGQIKEMQEQSELQLLPFVVLTTSSGGSGNYVIRNVGNGPAMNIQVALMLPTPDGAIKPSIVATYASVLTHGQENEVASGDYDPFEDQEIRIIFANINRKRYFTYGKIKGRKTDIISSGPCEP